jgi:hypothetical protein
MNNVETNILPIENDQDADNTITINHDTVQVNSNEAESNNNEPTSADTITKSRYNLRPIRSNWKTRDFGLHISMAKALKNNPIPTDIALDKEAKNLVDNGVFEPTLPDDNDEAETLPSSCFLKEKYKPDGTFDKTKARLVAGGNFQTKNLIEEYSSPTVNLHSVMIMASIAAKEGYTCGTGDVPGAYLKVKNKSKIRMILNKEMARRICNLKPEWEKYIRSDGTLKVNLLKALYGLVESAYLWHEHVSKEIINQGYLQSKYDKCVFTKSTTNGPIVICIHVDDFLFMAPKDEYINVKNDIINAFPDINLEEGNTLSYTGMTFEFNSNKKEVKISQKGYVEDILRDNNIEGTASSPANYNIMKRDDKSKAISTNLYLSHVMKLMYLAKRTRPDILFSVSLLATRSQNPTEQDMNHINRIYKYLNGTKDLGLTLKPTSFDIHVYADASFGTHIDGKSHTGVIATVGMNGGAAYTSSTKQKLVTKSSTEAELVAANDGTNQIIWMRNFIMDIGFNIDKPSILYQDNKSTIVMSEKGHGNFRRTKHINIRYFYIKNMIDDNIIQMIHLPTNDMISDILTKPLTGSKFIYLRNLLLN